jgi:hypothetical protein
VEHKPDVQPFKRRERFSFEAFDALIGEALDDVEVVPVDNVVDLNANVVDLMPPDDAA